MSLFIRFAGIVNNFFQFGGPAGPGINNNSGVLEAKNSANNALAVFRGATPSGDDDFATKAYVDEAFKPLIVTAQANAVSALITNTSTEHYIVVSTPGTSAAAAYLAGCVLWDDGSGTGNVAILGPTDGVSIVVTTALSGGTFTFNANTQYVWDGYVWSSLAPSIAGVINCVDFTIGTSAAQSSTTVIPAGAVILSAKVKVTTPYSPTTTIAIGQTGTTGLLQATTDNFPTLAGEYHADQRTAWGATPYAVLVTVGNSPGAGAGVVTVVYSSATA